MRLSTLRAYLAAVAASAVAMDLIFLIWSGTYESFEGPADALWFPVIWLGAVALTLIGSFVPAAAMVGLSERFQIRSLPFFLGWSCAASLLLALLVTKMIWSPDVPPQDPEYLSFQHLLRRVSGLFAPAATIGGIAYWAIAGRRAGNLED